MAHTLHQAHQLLHQAVIQYLAVLLLLEVVEVLLLLPMELLVALVGVVVVKAVLEALEILQAFLRHKEITVVQMLLPPRKVVLVAVEEHRLQEQTEHQRLTLVTVVTVALAQHPLFLVHL